MSINRGVDKDKVVGIYNGILLSRKKNEIMPYAATRMDLERDCHRVKSVKESQIYDVTHMWNLKYDTNELIYKTEMDSQKTDLCGGSD